MIHYATRYQTNCNSSEEYSDDIDLVTCTKCLEWAGIYSSLHSSKCNIYAPARFPTDFLVAFTSALESRPERQRFLWYHESGNVFLAAKGVPPGDYWIFHINPRD